MSGPDPEAARDRVVPILARARSEADYADQLRRTPESTLRAAGVPDEWIMNLAGEIRQEGQSAGDLHNEIWCTVWSCLFTAWWE